MRAWHAPPTSNRLFLALPNYKQTNQHSPNSETGTRQGPQINNRGVHTEHTSPSPSSYSGRTSPNQPTHTSLFTWAHHSKPASTTPTTFHYIDIICTRLHANTWCICVRARVRAHLPLLQVVLGTPALVDDVERAAGGGERHVGPEVVPIFLIIAAVILRLKHCTFTPLYQASACELPIALTHNRASAHLAIMFEKGEVGQGRAATAATRGRGLLAWASI